MSRKKKVIDFQKETKKRLSSKQGNMQSYLSCKDPNAFPGFENISESEASIVKGFAEAIRKSKESDPWLQFTSIPPDPNRPFTQDELQRAWVDWKELLSEVERKLAEHKLIEAAKQSLEPKKNRFEHRMQKLEEMIRKRQSKLNKTGVHWFSTWHGRIFLYCSMCHWIWSKPLRFRKHLPKDFGVCPNGCNKGKEPYAASTSEKEEASNIRV